MRVVILSAGLLFAAGEIVPDFDLLEPAIYAGNEGVRVEQVVLVTDDGCELLSGHDLAL